MTVTLSIIILQLPAKKMLLNARMEFVLVKLDLEGQIVVSAGTFLFLIPVRMMVVSAWMVMLNPPAVNVILNSSELQTELAHVRRSTPCTNSSA